MSDRKSAVSSALGVPVYCYYLPQFGPGSVPDPQEVAACLDRIAHRFDRYALLRTLRSVSLYWPTCPESPASFRDGSGRSGWYDSALRAITLNSEADWAAGLAHEVGHHVTYQRLEQLAQSFRFAFGEGATPPPGAAELWRWLADQA